jgi:hypothetical protein
MLMTETHCGVNEERSDSFRFRKIIKEFDLKFYHEHSFLILVPLNGCSVCIRPTLEFIQNNGGLKNVTCIITDIGLKRISVYAGDVQNNGLLIIPDESAKLYNIEPYINSPVIYYIRNGRFYKRIILGSRISPKIFSEILISEKF